MVTLLLKNSWETVAITSMTAKAGVCRDGVEKEKGRSVRHWNVSSLCAQVHRMKASTTPVYMLGACGW